MKQELIFTGKNVDEAVKEAAASLGRSAEELTYEVLEQEKSGFLGIGSTPAKIKVETAVSGDVIAKDFIETLIRNMEIEASVEVIATKKSDRRVEVKGEPAGILIGHHGETLEALQYLTNLAANKREEDESRDYLHISVDIENYRAKRETTLRSLARRMAAKVQKTGKSVMLEPMSPYERRIIHAEVQGIEGVSTNSVGVDSGRRVVIYLESEGFSVPQKKNERSQKRRSRNRSSENRAARERNEEKKTVKAPLHDDGERMSAEEISDLVSTYASKDKAQQRENHNKFKSFDDYLNSILGDSDSEGGEG